MIETLELNLPPSNEVLATMVKRTDREKLLTLTPTEVTERLDQILKKPPLIGCREIIGNAPGISPLGNLGAQCLDDGYVAWRDSNGVPELTRSECGSTVAITADTSHRTATVTRNRPLIRHRNSNGSITEITKTTKLQIPIVIGMTLYGLLNTSPLENEGLDEAGIIAKTAQKSSEAVQLVEAWVDDPDRFRGWFTVKPIGTQWSCETYTDDVTMDDISKFTRRRALGGSALADSVAQQRDSPE